MNNLDPDVAERPDDLVVYGGTGRAARSWDAFDAIVATLAPSGRRRDAAGAERQAGGGVSHAPGRAARAHREQQPRARDGRPGMSSGGSSALGLTMYGQMTAGSWIYIGSQGILQGTYETFAAVARPPLRRIAGWPARGDGRTRRHGWRAAAGRDDARRRDARRSRSIRRGSRSGWPRGYCDRMTRDLDEALAWLGGGAACRGRAVRRTRRQRRGRSSRARAARCHAGCSDRPDERARHAQRLRAGGDVAGRGGGAARDGPGGVRRAGRAKPPRCMCARCWSCVVAAR